MRWIAVVWASLVIGASPVPAGETTTTSDLVAVVPPTTVVAGRVLLKDGVTPVARAQVLVTGEVDGEPRMARSDRWGRFKLRLPAGQYGLQISRQTQVYKGRAIYRVPPGGRIDIDFLLLPDFESADGVASGDPDPPAITQGPDPVLPSPVEVGSVVDMVRSHADRRLGRWSEALGFLGSLLAVALAAH